MRRLKSPAAVFAAVLVMSVMPLASAQTPVPSFSKVFVPDTIGPGSSATLRFDIVNKGAPPVDNLAFTDTLPVGVTIATPASVRSTCGGDVSAPDGGTTISLSGGRLGADAGCAIRVNVTHSTSGVNGTIGTHTNVSGDLTSSAGNSGPASADLIVDGNLPGFSKSFAPASIPPGGTSVLTLTIDNTRSEGSAGFLDFTDPLPPGMVVATPANASTTCTGGTLTAAPGSTTISYFSGSLAGGAICEVTVDVTAAAAGRFVNTTLELTSGALNGGSVSSGFATAVLTVPVEFLVKSFTDDPVAPGDTVTLDFTVTNPSRTDPATNISFTDDLAATLSGLTALGLPLTDPCGAGSQLTGPSTLSLTGGSLPAEGSCTFSVTLQVPGSAARGKYLNTTSAVTANIGGEPVTGNQANDSLVVSMAPKLTKTFTDDPVAAGGTATLEFTVTNISTTSAATGIAFTDNLTAVLTGLAPTPTGLPADGFCGAGSSMTTFTDNFQNLQLSMAGGSLAAGTSCTFDVTLQVPTSAVSSTYGNTTSPISATVDGMVQEGRPATDSLTVVGGPRLAKSFSGDPVAPGGTVTLEFTLGLRPEAPGDATGITFTDDLNATLSGLAAVDLPQNDVCGVGSQLAGTTNLTFSGGTLSPGSSCTFSTTLSVPAGAATGSYANITSDVSATVSGLTVTRQPATDDLAIQPPGPVLTKSFTSDPVVPGDTVTLEFNITNNSTTDGASSLTFTDDLDAVLSGLAATGLPASDVCGSGSVLAGTTTLTLTGGNLAAGASCTFSATLAVPAGAASGQYTNTTEQLTGLLGGSAFSFGRATAEVVVSDPVHLAKSFTDDPVVVGGTVNLEFTITNISSTDSVTAIAFSDDLSGVLPGLSALGLPQNDVCGIGSELAGTTILTLTGGSLAPGGSCTFTAPLRVPVGALDGTYPNTTSAVTALFAGSPASGDPASDALQVGVQELAFSDVLRSHPFFAEITWMAQEGISTGYSDGTFRPTAPVTRQAVAAFLYRLMGSPAGPFPDPGFSDVPPSHPFHTEILWLVDSGIATGFPDGTFRPTARVTRQTVAAFFYRLMGSPAGPFPDPGFSDVPPSHPFYTEISWLADSGIASGYPDGTFRPTVDITRQAMAAFLYRTSQLLGG